MPGINNIQRASLRGLRTFCVAARYESFRAAADELFITSSAVSHQIKGLEEQLGLQLFDRGSRELKLTDVGSSLYEELFPLIDQVDSVVAGYQKAGRRESVRVSVQPFFASEFFVPRLSEFAARYPDIDIQVGTSDESAEKHPADADLSIRLFRAPPPGYRSDLLFPLRMAPAGSPDFKKAMVVRGKQIRSAFPLIVHETRPKAWRNWSQATGIDIPTDSKVTRLDSMIAVVRAAEQGLGAALVPVPIADLWFQQGSIVRLFKEDLVSDVSYYLVSKDDQGPNQAVDILRDWILQNFAEHD